MLVVRLLGAVGVELDGRAIDIGSTKQRIVLAVLAVSTGTVSRARLIDALWPDTAPPSAPSTLMGYVSRLRSSLGADAVAGHGDGYRLVADEVDVRTLDAILRDADAGIPALERALALWRGDPFGDLADHPVLVGEAVRLSELRLDARIRLAAAYLAAGDAVRPVSMLEAIVADAPLREDAWGLLVRALLDAGRSAEAVRAAHRCRRQLAEIGLEPGPALVDVEATALQQRVERTTTPTVGPIRYARRGGGHLAYQVIGGGPVDLVLSSYGSISIDSIWDGEHFSSFVTRLATACRVVLYDTRGIGLSDPIDVANPPTIEEQAEDLRTVLVDAQAAQAVVVGVADGGPTAIAFAGTRPPGLLGLVLVNTFARLVEAEDYRGVPRDRFEANLSMSVDPETARDTSLVLRNHAPSVAGDATFRRWWDRAGRRGASPATANALWRVRYGADVRALLPQIAVPTLVIHRTGTRVVPLAHGEYLAAHLPRARLVEMAGADQPPFTEDADTIADTIVSFSSALARR